MRRKAWTALLAVLVMSGDGAAQPAVEDRWRAFESDQFHFYSNAPRGRTRELVTSFGRLHNLLSQGRADDIAMTPVTVIVFKSRYSIEPYLRKAQTYDIVRTWESLHTQDRLWLLLNSAATDDVRPQAYRAYVGNYLYDQLPDLPYWAQEGLANFYAGFRDRKGAEVAVGLPHPKFIITLRETSVLPWQEVFAVQPDSDLLTYPRGLARFKAQAWIAAHMLMTGGPRQDLAGKFFGPLHEGHSEQAILEEVFGWSLEDFDNHVRNYYDKGSLPYFPWDVGDIDPEPAEERKMSTQEVRHLLATYLVTSRTSAPDIVLSHVEPLLADPDWTERGQALLDEAGLSRVTDGQR